jgi:hypothetical protein
MGNSLDVLAQNISTLSDAINKAGSLRMLSQRMIKAWLQLISGILPEASQKILDDSIILFDRRLSDLKVYTAKNMATITLYESLEKEWNEFKKIIRVNTTDATTVNNVIAKSDQLRNRADAALGMLAQTSTAPISPLVEKAGRQRMLSQLIARELIRSRLPGQPKGESAVLSDSLALFRVNHTELVANPGNNGAIKSQLELVATMWIFFENALKSKAPEALAQVAGASESLLAALERLVSMYERAL